MAENKGGPGRAKGTGFIKLQGGVFKKVVGVSGKKKGPKRKSQKKHRKKD